MFLPNKLRYKALCKFRDFRAITSKQYVKMMSDGGLWEECVNLNTPASLILLQAQKL